MTTAIFVGVSMRSLHHLPRELHHHGFETLFLSSGHPEQAAPHQA